MTLEQYKALSTELGIDRGALKDGEVFPFELASTVASNKDKPIDYTIPMRVRLAEGPDLTHLNPITSTGKSFAKPRKKQDNHE